MMLHDELGWAAKLDKRLETCAAHRYSSPLEPSFVDVLYCRKERRRKKERIGESVFISR